MVYSKFISRTSDCPYVINKTSYGKLPKQYQKLLQDLKPEALASESCL